MTIAQLIPMAINLSMGLMVFALGLQASWRDAAYLLRQPGLFTTKGTKIRRTRSKPLWFFVSFVASFSSWSAGGHERRKDGAP